MGNSSWDKVEIQGALMRRHLGESRISLGESSTTRPIYKVLTGTKGTPGQSCGLQEPMLSRNNTTRHWSEDQSVSREQPSNKSQGGCWGHWELGLVVSPLFKTELQASPWIKTASCAFPCLWVILSLIHFSFWLWSSRNYSTEGGVMVWLSFSSRLPSFIYIWKSQSVVSKLGRSLST